MIICDLPTGRRSGVTELLTVEYVRGGYRGGPLAVGAAFGDGPTFLLASVDMGGYFRATWMGLTSATQVRLSVLGNASEIGSPEYLDVYSADYTYTEAVGGMWPLRQRQSLIGGGSWPLRQRQNGAHSGSWPLRQRQTGV